MLDAVIEYMPSPADIGSCGWYCWMTKMDQKSSAHPKDDEPFAALAFKISTDPFCGTLTYFRVLWAITILAIQFYNPLKGKRERIGRFAQMHSNSREEIKAVCASW